MACVVAVLVGFVVAGVAGGSAFGVVAIVGPLGAAFLRSDRSAEQVANQVPALLEQLARSARGGATVVQGFADAAATLPVPIALELEHLGRQLDHGVAFDEVVADWSARHDGDAVSIAVAAVLLAERLGGAQALSFDGLAQSLRARAEVRAEAKALASQAIASAVLIGSAPLAFAFLLGITGSSVLAVALSSRVALASVVAGLALELIGAVWMRRIVR